MTRGRPGSTLFPYTTLFRSRPLERGAGHDDLQRRACALDRRLRDAGGLEAEMGRGSRDSTSPGVPAGRADRDADRKSTRLNSSHSQISYAVFCLKKKKRTDD